MHLLFAIYTLSNNQFIVKIFVHLIFVAFYAGQLINTGVWPTLLTLACSTPNTRHSQQCAVAKIFGPSLHQHGIVMSYKIRHLHITCIQVLCGTCLASFQGAEEGEKERPVVQYTLFAHM